MAWTCCDCNTDQGEGQYRCDHVTSETLCDHAKCSECTEDYSGDWQCSSCQGWNRSYQSQCQRSTSLERCNHLKCASCG
ncbi:hypothetical protein DM02DRAFT_617047 [Periconia macrospinosa]|uniref:RanBP2-type domain-containing protein n=1 Tax=Periconia macrospinosa TaxID=97972 RepID=A0A2V1DF84_9PLEO|nr:hypothetical protein DM02DRAFT_617047 [Periconia macrospinosa]